MQAVWWLAIPRQRLPHLCIDWGEVMPLYEYSCAECGTYASTSSSYVDNLPIMECPKCMTIMNRLYSAPGIVFKGTGWGSKP